MVTITSLEMVLNSVSLVLSFKFKSQEFKSQEPGNRSRSEENCFNYFLLDS